MPRTRIDKAFYVLLVAALLLLATLVAKCAERVQRVNVEIPAACIRKVLLQDCDVSGDAPKCAHISVDYGPRSCGILQIVKDKK